MAIEDGAASSNGNADPPNPPEPSSSAEANVELQNPPRNSEPEEVEIDAAPRQMSNIRGGVDAGVSELPIREVESRIVHAFNARIDSVALAFNETFAQGLGEVQPKCEVGLRDIVTDNRRGRRFGLAFPMRHLATNCDLEGFKVTIFELRRLKFNHASSTYRDIWRFFDFPNDAGDDLPNLLVSIFKLGLLHSLQKLEKVGT